MADRLKVVGITAEKAVQFAKNLGVADPSKYAQITKLGVVCEQALKERIHEPQKVVEALIVTKGLGRYAKGLVCKFPESRTATKNHY